MLDPSEPRVLVVKPGHMADKCLGCDELLDSGRHALDCPVMRGTHVSSVTYEEATAAAEIAELASILYEAWRGEYTAACQTWESLQLWEKDRWVNVAKTATMLIEDTAEVE